MEIQNPSKVTLGRGTVPDRPAPGAPGVGVPSTATDPGVTSGHAEAIDPRVAIAIAKSGASRTKVIPNTGAWTNLPSSAARAPPEFSPCAVGPAAALPPRSPVPDVFALLKALRHRWPLAVGLGTFFAMVASSLTWFLLPTTLMMATATAKVRIQPVVRSVSAVWGDRVDPGVFKRTMCDFLKTRPVMEAALQDPDVAGLSFARAPNAAEMLEQRVKVDAHDASEIFDVSVSGDNPAQATFLVNAVVKAFARKAAEEDRGHKEELLAEYERVRNENERAVAVNLARVHSRKRLGLGGDSAPDFQGQMDLENFRRAQADVREVTGKLLGLQRRLEFEQDRQQQRQEDQRAKRKVGKKASEVPRHLIDEETEKDAKANELRKKKEHYEQLIQGYESMANASSTLVRATLRGYKEDLKQIDIKLQKREEELLPRIRARLGTAKEEAPQETNQSIEQMRAEIEYYKAQEKFAREEYDKAREKVQKAFGQSTAEVEKWAKEVERHQEVAKHFNMEAEALRLELRSPPRIEVVQLAMEPRPKDPHRQTKTIILAGISAFLFVGFCTAWFEFRSQRIHHADEVVRGLGLRLLGTVPVMPDSVRRHPLSLNDPQDRRPHNLVTESFDGIRTMVLHEARQMPLRVLMVASAVSGEGKTTLASHLAMSLAQAGRRTLLIDCDLVHPTQQVLFEQPLQPGLCEVLRGEAELVSALISTSAHGLSLLPAGRYDGQVSQIIAKGWIQNLLDKLKEDYEFIIIDTAPALSVANTLLIGQHADGAVLALLCDVSQVPQVHAAYQRLAALGIRVVGCVFGKARDDSYGYYGYGHDDAGPEPAPPIEGMTPQAGRRPDATTV